LRDPISEKSHHKKELVEWLKVKALSSTPVLGEKKKASFNSDVNGCGCFTFLFSL
jgi:hypothetical protein